MNLPDSVKERLAERLTERFDKSVIDNFRENAKDFYFVEFFMFLERTMHPDQLGQLFEVFLKTPTGAEWYEDTLEKHIDAEIDRLEMGAEV